MHTQPTNTKEISKINSNTTVLLLVITLAPLSISNQNYQTFCRLEAFSASGTACGTAPSAPCSGTTAYLSPGGIE